MDYWPRLKLTVHDDTETFFNFARAQSGSIWLLSSKGDRSLWQAPFADGDWLVFGSETAGISEKILTDNPGHVLRIPQVPGERCLNLSAAASVALFEALRQIHSDTIPPL